MLGGIYNETTKETGLRRAGAFHADGRFGPWNVQLEVMGYRFEPKNPPGVDPSFVQLAGFRFPFLMAAEGSELTLNLARDFNPGHRFLEAATCYTDFSTVAPRVSRLDSSTQIVTGCLLTKGGLYTYMDWITGRNMWFAGGPGIGLASVDPDPWKGRLNINMGFYFSEFADCYETRRPPDRICVPCAHTSPSWPRRLRSGIRAGGPHG